MVERFPIAVRVVLAVLALSFPGVKLLGAETFLGVERARIERVIFLGYNMDPLVKDEIAALQRAHPESPVPDLLEVGRLYWLQAYAQWDEEKSAAFEAAADASLRKAEAYAAARPDDLDATFVVAMNELSQVIYAVDRRRWWAAFWKARTSLKTMRRILEKDPDYHDAKMPLGMANCYLSRTPAYLKPLAFLMRFKGDWETGLAYMEAARDHGLFTEVDAAYYLGGIRIELQEDPELARAEFVALADRFPGNALFQVMAAQFERATGHSGSARERLVALLPHPQLEELIALKMRAHSELCWAALGSGKPELALATSYQADAVIAADARLIGYQAWIAIARAEALKSLDRVGEAIATLEAVGPTEDHGQKVAQEKLAAFRAAAAGQ